VNFLLSSLPHVSLKCCAVKREGAIEPTGVIVPSEDAIAFEDAMVVTPADATLVRDLNLSVPAGTNLLVTGPNGSGKSSLFRVLGGLWPLTKGRIHKPGGTTGDGLSHDIFYVPQRPYVTLGTLEEQLIYPLTASGHPSSLHSYLACCCTLFLGKFRCQSNSACQTLVA